MCSSCNTTYYAKTEFRLNVRSGEYIGLSLLTGNRVAGKSFAISVISTTYRSYVVRTTTLNGH